MVYLIFLIPKIRCISKKHFDFFGVGPSSEKLWKEKIFFKNNTVTPNIFTEIATPNIIESDLLF